MTLTGTDRGTGTHNSNSTSLSITPASNLTAGSIAVLCVAYDNSGTSGADPYSSLSDTLGNAWTVTRTLNDPSTASAGVVLLLARTAQASGTLTTSSTITLAFSATTRAKAWALMEIAGGVGEVPIIISTGTGATGTGNASITTGTVTVGDMVVAASANEYGTAQTPTHDSDTTNGTWSSAQYAEIGSTTSGVNIASQRKLQTTTNSTQTYDVSYSSSSDWAANYLVIGILQAIYVNAPAIGATVMLPPQPPGTEGLTGRLGYAPVGRFTLGDASVNDVHQFNTAWVKIAAMPGTESAITGVPTGSVTWSSSPSVPAPVVTAAVSLPSSSVAGGLPSSGGRLGYGRLAYFTLGDVQAGTSAATAIADVGGAPATSVATPAVTAGSVATAGASIAAPLVTATAASSADGLAVLSGIPDVATAAGAVTGPSAVLADVPGELVIATAAPTSAAFGVGTPADVVTSTAATDAPLPSAAGIPASVGGTGATADASVTTSAASSIAAPLVTASAATADADRQVSSGAPLTTATPAIGSPSAATAPVGVTPDAAGSASYAPAAWLWSFAPVTTTTGAVVDGSVSVNPMVEVAGQLVTATGAPYDGTAAGWSTTTATPDAATATGAVITGAVGGWTETIIDAETVGATSATDGATAWTIGLTETNAPTVGATAAAADGTIASFQITAAAAPTVGGVAELRGASVSGQSQRGRRRGPRATAGALIPVILAASATPDGQASSGEPT